MRLNSPTTLHPTYMHLECVQGSLGMDEDPELAHAIAASLASMQGGSTGPSPSAAGAPGDPHGPRTSAMPPEAPNTQSKLGLHSHPVDFTAANAKTTAIPGNAGAEAVGSMGGKPCEDDDEALVELVVKLPDSQRAQASFRRADRVGYVISWLHGQGWNMKKHKLCRAYPKTTLDESLRLQDEGVQSREMLIVERLK